MRKMIFALLLAVAVIFPSTTFAGQGATKLFCAWFNDSSGISNSYFRPITNIHVFNPNNNDATINITYYKPDGSAYENSGTSQTTFTHTIQSRHKIGWRPNNDLDIYPDNTTQELKGSFVMEVTQGSVIADSGISIYVGDSFPDQGDDFNVDDMLSVHSFPMDTNSYTALSMDGFIEYENGTDNQACDVGEYATFIHINNPNDTSATLTLTFYEDDGDVYAGTSAETLNIPAHGTATFTPYNYNIKGTSSTSPAKGYIEIDVTTGSVIAVFAKHVTTQNKESKSFSSAGFSFNKSQIFP